MQDLSTELKPELKLDDPFVDAVHAEFVQLLDAAARADDAHFLQAYDAWIDHCRQHFEREERWMASTKFGPQYCHAADHDEVLKVASAVRDKVARDAQFELGRRLLTEVSEWFDHHVRTMDSMMVSHLKMLNFVMVDAPTEV
ncbi:bacteriohemerythrin [Burkholderia humptydooensis]|uniref:Bacteriohemerythrin n=2 Tax=Burkholderia humptydooensis TaxID=430531 RepID=A0A7U4P771_9BURK|nr:MULTISPECIES: bacteriohemerythrin [Burkholderia]AJY41631.1 hemerythrin-like metal-binding domain protein [Burkholderia sp. 2002721687]ALX44268.1 cation-binding hemerythrin HHE family protein [Burkholderia humptydooensis]QPS42720.1 bacteriohemerythrin [Burkholderia humptydooensis]